MKNFILLYLRDGNFCEEGEFNKEDGYVYCYNPCYGPFPVTINKIRNDFEIKGSFEI